MSRDLKEVRGLARGRVCQAKREARANALRWAVRAAALEKQQGGRRDQGSTSRGELEE